MAGSTPVSIIEMGAVVNCGVFTQCDADCNAEDVNSGMDDSTFTVRAVT